MPGSTVSTPVNQNKNLYNGGSKWQNDYGNMPDYYQTYYLNYDAAIGRWVGVDPNPESAESMTVYQYGGNNPVLFNDPLGDQARLPETIPVPASGGTIGTNAPDLAAGDMASEFGTNFSGIPNYAFGGGGSSGTISNYMGIPGATLTNIYTAGDDYNDPSGLSMGQLNGLIGSGGRTTVNNYGVTFYTQTMEMRQNATPVDKSYNSSVEYVMVEHKDFHSFDNLANQGEETPYYDALNKVNSTVGTTTILGLTGASVGYLKGGSVSLKWYSSGWTGGSRAIIKTARLSKVAETVGRVGVGIGFVADTYEFVNGNISGSHYATNTVMGGIALTPVGFFTIPYFVIDAYYPGGFTAAMHDSAPLYNQMNQPNAAPPQVLMGMP
ncbi:RHS repeat-associated protein [Mucilaginibacter sp. SG538B]|uniref:hypothetical protein n=1 Tax=Mucilaginibacter sp. SG538B TaxID=2587021 RepID=UPI00159E9049|nr:hypothetical protein [Mucilaginibacter sp. SG538B]NVM62214.1 RHS repeat-associated protein [Mucilaginibacter sp. SG538B]